MRIARLVFFFSVFTGLFSNTIQSISEQTQTVRILIGTPIRQKPDILKEFLFSLRSLNKERIAFDFCFIDDNVDERSSALLQQFSQQVPGTCFIYKSNAIDMPYICNEVTHYWSDETVWKVAEFKNGIIRKAHQENYDYLFLVDSDIVLNPLTIKHLISTNKDIISEIFWTRWAPDQQELPQVWISDVYNLTDEFVNQLRKPGVYEVGGLGACTLINKKALAAGISFSKIKNITFWGEDRHFCIRAVALGLSLFVDTHFPAYHIYRESALAGVEEFKRNNNLVDEPDNGKRHKITLSMCVKNEADHYLRRVLESAREYIDEAVFIDDGCTDNTIEVCRQVLQGIPVHVIRNEESRFGNEITLREQQWEEVVRTNPDWIVVLDADEIFEDKFKDEVRTLIEQDDVDVWCFRLFDFWDEHHYRDDAYWSAHTRYRPFLVRYKKDFNYDWNRQAHHCGRLPRNILNMANACSDLRLKHYGWAKPEDRIAKYHRYMKFDPEGKYGIMAQYESILDEHPHLLEWVE